MNRTQSCPNGERDGKFCACIYTIKLNVGDICEFVFVDEGFTFQSNHPIHLHGTAFALMGIERLKTSVTTNEIVEMDNKGLLRRNFHRPIIKDTVTVPVGGYTILRFRADNPGTWMVHCHIEFHAEIGMAFLLKMYDYIIISILYIYKITKFLYSL